MLECFAPDTLRQHVMAEAVKIKNAKLMFKLLFSSIADICQLQQVKICITAVHWIPNMIILWLNVLLSILSGGNMIVREARLFKYR